MMIRSNKWGAMARLRSLLIRPRPSAAAAEHTLQEDTRNDCIMVNPNDPPCELCAEFNGLVMGGVSHQ